MTITSRILLIWRSVALNTGYRFRTKNTTDRPNPTPTKTQLRMEMGDHEIRATGIHIRFEYPYRAQHSKRFADSLPKYRRARNRATGMTKV